MGGGRQRETSHHQTEGGGGGGRELRLYEIRHVIGTMTLVI